MTYLQNERTKGNKTSSLTVVTYISRSELCYEHNEDCPNWQGFGDNRGQHHITQITDSY